MSDDDSPGDGPPDSRPHDVVETAVGALRALLGERSEEASSPLPSGSRAENAGEDDPDPPASSG